MSAGVNSFLCEAMGQLNERVTQSRGDNPPVDVLGKRVLVVDNGIHTGSTILVSLRALRRLHPARITVAVPVASISVRETVEALCDELICLRWSESFGNIAMWYQKFDRPSDEQVCKLITKVNKESGRDKN